MSLTALALGLTALASAAYTAHNNKKNRDFNAQQSAMARAFEERMSNTAHQREVKDLQAAGLNPILSAGGQGASTPSGNAASASDSGGNPANALSVSLSALQAANVKHFNVGFK